VSARMSQPDLPLFLQTEPALTRTKDPSRSWVMSEFKRRIVYIRRKGGKSR
jgi:hypothetical protein